MEVLISTFVVMVGLLGLAVLLPVGRITINEATKMDRAGECGRAALRDVKVRRMLDPMNWSWQRAKGMVTITSDTDSATFLSYSQPSIAITGTNVVPQPSFFIDPLIWDAYKSIASGTQTNSHVPAFGCKDDGNGTNGFSSTLGTSANPYFQRITLKTLIQATTAGSTFNQVDGHSFVLDSDLVYGAVEGFKTRPGDWPGSLAWPPTRPTLGTYAGTSTNTTINNGISVPVWNPTTSHDFSWFATVTPLVSEMALQPQQRTRYTVSIVVCHRRDMPQDWTTPLEKAVKVGNFMDAASGIALGGGSVQLVDASNNPTPLNDSAGGAVAGGGITVKENEWVALCSTGTGLCQWYRVVGIGDDSSQLTLLGPDWPITPASLGSDFVVALGKSVIGVYTSVIELDTDPAWQQ